MRRLSFLLVLVLSVMTSYAGDWECPAFLQPGDTVAIISPSYAGSASAVQSAETVLRQWGLVPVSSGYIQSTYMGKLAGTEQERAQDLMWALQNPSVKAVMATRGGYGSIHLMGRIAPETFAFYPKWIIGYSDITSLLAAESSVGVMSIHGAMCSSFPSHSTDSTCTLVRDLLMGTVPSYTLPASQYNITGQATGRLVGGNLCTLYPLVGTVYDPTLDDEGIILFIEEVGENYHTIDRMINMLRLQGVFSRLRGVILGDWASCSADLTYASVPAMLREYFQPLGIPVCCDFPAGHGSVNLPLVMGSLTTIDVTSSGATVTMDLGASPSALPQVIDTDAPLSVFDLMGRPVSDRYPTMPGVWVVRQGDASRVVVIR